MKKKLFYLLFLLFPLVVIGGSLHAQGWSGPIDTNWKGSGTESSPYLIETAEQLAGLASEVNNSTGGHYLGVFFKLNNDIDFTNHPAWVPIGYSDASGSKPFQGTFNGNGKIIRNLTVYTSSLPSNISSFGLFGYIEGATIKKLIIENINIPEKPGPSWVGGLVGLSDSSNIIDCSVGGHIVGSIFVGALVGRSYGTNITTCYAFVSLLDGANKVGGLVGSLEAGSSLSASLSLGLIVGFEEVGGLAGSVKDDGTEILNSYSLATVVAQKSSSAGGSSIGGILGWIGEGSSIVNCFASNPKITGEAQTVHRVVGGFANSSILSKKGNSVGNFALKDMLVSKNAGLTYTTIQDSANDPEFTADGKGISEDEWKPGDPWNPGDDDDDNVYPYLPMQTAPVVCIKTNVDSIQVKHIRPLDPSRMDTIILLDSTYTKLAIGTQINTDGGKNKTANIWTFTPVGNNKFKIGQVFYAVAYEKGKMPSIPVKIVISKFENGTGSKNYPFEIHTPAELDAVRENLKAYYILMKDLDMAKYPVQWQPIGTSSNPFTGGFNGNFHVIDSLKIKGTGDYQGLFGYVNGDAITNLGLENIYVTGKDYVGALAGKASTPVKNVYTTGTIKATGSYIGGLAGMVSDSVKYCYSTCLVKGQSFVGGLIGESSSVIKHCYAVGPVFGDAGIGYAGGLLGSSNKSTVQFSFAAGFVSGHICGGFIGTKGGYSDITTVNNCYFDSISTGTSNGIGEGMLLSSSKLEPKETSAFGVLLNGFGDENVWAFTKNYYPQLVVFSKKNENTKIKSCSAFSVVPIVFANNESAEAVSSSFPAPSADATGNALSYYPHLASDLCFVEAGKVYSIYPSGTDTLRIMDVSKVNGKTEIIHGRAMCFIPDHDVDIEVDAKPTAESVIGKWTNKDVSYELSAKRKDGVDVDLISGDITYLSNARFLGATDNWKEIGNKHVFDKDTVVVLQYKVKSKMKTFAGIYPKVSGINDTIRIDKTRPKIAAMDTNGTKDSHAQKQATVTVKFKDPRVSDAVEPSGIKKMEWEIPNIEPIQKSGISNIEPVQKGVIDIGQLTPDAEGYLTENFTLPQMAGHYPIVVTLTDNAGNVIDNNDAGFPMEVYVDDDNLDDDNYVLEKVTVDGDDAKVDLNDPLVWWYSESCVGADTAIVELTPAPAFGYTKPIVFTIRGLNPGDNERKIIIISKDEKIAQTFTIHICRDVSDAFFRSLFVNEYVKLKPQKTDYSVSPVDYDVSEVLVEYELEPGESCSFNVATPSVATYSGYHALNEPGKNTTFVFPVTSADGLTTRTYNVTVPRKTKDPVEVTDSIGYGNSFEDDPLSQNTNPYIDNDGNIAYDLVSKCDVTEHYLKITPKPAGTVTFKDGNGPAETRDNNTYRFEVAKRYKITAVVTSSDNGSRTYVFNIVKKFNESIFYNRWASNDVITVNNNPNNNGGYSFTEYSWTLNGVPSTETRSYMEVGKDNIVVATLSGEYNSPSTGAIAINEVPTCPCLISAPTRMNILAYPNLLKSGETITISAENISEEDLKESSVNIINSLGNAVDKTSLTGSITEIAMPRTPGIYLLKVSTKSVSKEFKVILK